MRQVLLAGLFAAATFSVSAQYMSDAVPPGSIAAALQTSGQDVDVSSSPPPIAGAILTATSATTAEWLAPSNSESILTLDEADLRYASLVDSATQTWVNGQLEAYATVAALGAYVTNSVLTTSLSAYLTTTTASVTYATQSALTSEVTNLTSELATKAAAATTITAGTGLTGGGDLSANRTISLANTAVTPGAYTSANITVDPQGRITAASNGSGGSALPADDGVAIVKGSSDATKQVRFEVDGNTSGTTRVITPPDANTWLPVLSVPLTFSGPTAARSYTLPDANATIARSDAAQTFAGTQTFNAAPTSPGTGGATSERWGAGAIASGSGATALGNAASAAGASGLALGDRANANDSIAIGTVATSSGTGVAIGYTASCGPGVCIGRQATATDANGVGMAIGYAPNAGAFQSFAFGRGATATANRQLVFGADINSGIGTIQTAYLGCGVRCASASSYPAIWSGSQGTGTNISGGDLKIAGGPATGNGFSGSTGFQTSFPGASGATTQTLVDRELVGGSPKALTESSASGLFEVSVAANTVMGATVYYTIEANDGTDFQSLRGSVPFAAVNKAGAITATIGAAVDVSAASAGTLAVTPTVTAGANKVTFTLNAVSSLTQSVLRGTWHVILDGGSGIVTPL